MTELICDSHEELAQWVEREFPEFGPIGRPLTAIGVKSSAGDMLAVAIYNNFSQNDTGETYNLHITFVASDPKWATPGNVRAVLHYPFIQLGVKRMTSIVNKSNKRARKLNEGIGFKLEGTHPYGDNGGSSSLTYGLYSQDVKDKWFHG